MKGDIIMNTLIKPPCTNSNYKQSTTNLPTVEDICEIFCQIIEDCDEDTPWSDASYNDRMREAQIIYDKLKSGEASDAYEECYGLLAIYNE